MTELEKIAYAKTFLDKLANGINPLDGSTIPENEVVNHVRLSRCFFYVSDILRQVIENGGIQQSPSVPNKRKTPFYLDDQAKMELSPLPYAVQGSMIVDQINLNVDSTGMQKLKKNMLSIWLLEIGLLEQIETERGTVKVPTELGKQIGLHTEQRTGYSGAYMVVTFDTNAQQFVYDHVDALADVQNRHTVTAENQGQPWDEEQTAQVVAMFQEGRSVKEIAIAMKRTVGAIRERLKKLGLIQ
jgi:hypothetical protein